MMRSLNRCGFMFTFITLAFSLYFTNIRCEDSEAQKIPFPFWHTDHYYVGTAKAIRDLTLFQEALGYKGLEKCNLAKSLDLGKISHADCETICNMRYYLLNKVEKKKEEIVVKNILRMSFGACSMEGEDISQPSVNLRKQEVEMIKNLPLSGGESYFFVYKTKIMDIISFYLPQSLSAQCEATSGIPTMELVCRESCNYLSEVKAPKNLEVAYWGCLFSKNEALDSEYSPYTINRDDSLTQAMLLIAKKWSYVLTSPKHLLPKGTKPLVWQMYKLRVKKIIASALPYLWAKGTTQIYSNLEEAQCFSGVASETCSQVCFDLYQTKSLFENFYKDRDICDTRRLIGRRRQGSADEDELHNQVALETQFWVLQNLDSKLETAFSEFLENKRKPTDKCFRSRSSLDVDRINEGVNPHTREEYTAACQAVCDVLSLVCDENCLQKFQPYDGFACEFPATAGGGFSSFSKTKLIDSRINSPEQNTKNLIDTDKANVEKTKDGAQLAAQLNALTLDQMAHQKNFILGEYERIAKENEALEGKRKKFEEEDKPALEKEKTKLKKEKDDFGQEKKKLKEEKAALEQGKSNFKKEKDEFVKEKGKFKGEKAALEQEKTTFKKGKDDFEKEKLKLEKEKAAVEKEKTAVESKKQFYKKYSAGFALKHDGQVDSTEDKGEDYCSKSVALGKEVAIDDEDCRTVCKQLYSINGIEALKAQNNTACQFSSALPLPQLHSVWILLFIGIISSVFFL